MMHGPINIILTLVPTCHRHARSSRFVQVLFYARCRNDTSQTGGKRGRFFSAVDSKFRKRLFVGGL